MGAEMIAELINLSLCSLQTAHKLCLMLRDFLQSGKDFLRIQYDDVHFSLILKNVIRALIAGVGMLFWLFVGGNGGLRISLKKLDQAV